ncbi:CTD small phosphatase-like protein 2 [Coemansia sp. RSA 2424]|nr:CTD small phosphatase-like protein 2 [Coemansia sp. RSA 2424]
MSTVARPRSGPKRQAAAVGEGTTKPRPKAPAPAVPIPVSAKKPVGIRQGNGRADKLDSHHHHHHLHHTEPAAPASDPPRRSRRNAGIPAEDDTATKSSDASRHNKATPAHPHSQSVSPIGPKPAVRAAQAKPKPTTAAVAQAGASVVKGAVRQRIAALESTKSHNSLVPPPAVPNNRRPIAQPASVSSRLAAATQTHAAKANGIAKAPASDMPSYSSNSNSAGFIMSSPKRKPREAHAGPSTPDSGPATKRRRSDAADGASSLTPTHAVAVPGFHSPLLKRVRPASSAAAADSSDESSSASTPSTKRVAKPMGQRPSRWARRVVADTGRGAAESSESESAAGASNIASQRSSDDAPSSSFKSILTPVLDLFRRVSGIAQDPLGLQQRPDSASSNASEAPSARASSSVAEASRSSAHPLSSDSADVFACAMPGALDSATTCAPPPGSIEANSLTAPPMNPTTIGGAAGPPSYLANCVGATGSCMQLYLPESAEIGGSVDSCSASPVTAGYPETPSKENIPMYGEYDFDAANDEITTMSAVALAGIPPAVSLLRAPEMAAAAATAHQESDLDLSQISSLADSDIDAQYEQYLQYEEDEDEFNPYLFMADLPPIPKEHTLRPYALPRKTRSSPPITLVLDLDETLVHCALTAVENADLVFPVEYNGLNYDVYCRLRPGYREFLEKASELFEVVVFTASQQVYADRLLNLIDPERRYIRHRLFRDSCVYVNTNYVKDLGILGRDESKMILVDNCPQAFAYQQSNGIPIESWYEDKGDRELMHLMGFLETLVGDDDVRPKVEAHFKTREKVAEAKKRFQFKLGAPYPPGPIYVRGTAKS